MRRGARAGSWLLPPLTLLPTSFALVTLLVLAAPSGIQGISIPATLAPQASSSLAGVVLFNGQNVTGASTPASALTASFANVFTVKYAWVATPPSAGPVTVSGAKLQMFFFGASIATKELDILNPTPTVLGSINLTADFTQYHYILEGVYLVTASILANGGTAFSESFYVHVQATDHLTLVNIALVILAIYEVYQIAVLGSVKIAATELGAMAAAKAGGAGGKP